MLFITRTYLKCAIEFTLDDHVTRARAYICGIGYYELYINNIKVCNLLIECYKINKYNQTKLKRLDFLIDTLSFSTKLNGKDRQRGSGSWMDRLL
jgi:hypothetical protein